MALISLEPGETFEHEHASESVTILKTGSVDFVVSGTRTSLERDVPRRVAAAVPHVMINVGKGTATINCAMHRDVPEPEDRA